MAYINNNLKKQKKIEKKLYKRERGWEYKWALDERVK